MVIRQYSVEWEKDPRLAQWIAKSINGEDACCNFCVRDIVPHKGTLIRHSISEAHQNNAAAQITIDEDLLTKKINGIASEKCDNTEDVPLLHGYHETLPIDRSAEKQVESLVRNDVQESCNSGSAEIQVENVARNVVQETCKTQCRDHSYAKKTGRSIIKR